VPTLPGVVPEPASLGGSLLGQRIALAEWWTTFTFELSLQGELPDGGLDVGQFAELKEVIDNARPGLLTKCARGERSSGRLNHDVRSKHK
jgi:hypothetical protein